MSRDGAVLLEEISDLGIVEARQKDLAIASPKASTRDDSPLDDGFPEFRQGHGARLEPILAQIPVVMSSVRHVFHLTDAAEKAMRPFGQARTPRFDF